MKYRKKDVGQKIQAMNNQNGKKKRKSVSRSKQTNSKRTRRALTIERDFDDFDNGAGECSRQVML